MPSLYSQWLVASVRIAVVSRYCRVLCAGASDVCASGCGGCLWCPRARSVPNMTCAASPPSWATWWLLETLPFANRVEPLNERRKRAERRTCTGPPECVRTVWGASEGVTDAHPSAPRPDNPQYQLPAAYKHLTRPNHRSTGYPRTYCPACVALCCSALPCVRFVCWLRSG